MMKSKIILLGTCLLVTQAAFAEDDLMQILEGKSASHAAPYVENEEIQKLKKAINPATAEQNIFFQFLSEKNYEKALFQWSAAYGTANFAQEPTGKALGAWLSYKNGLRITSVEDLMAISEPQKIDNTIVSLWKESLNGDDNLWNLVQVTWNPFWTGVFGDKAEMAVLLQKSYVDTDIAALTDLIKRTTPDSKERALLQWQLVLNLGIKGDSSKAAQVLAHLMKLPNNPIDKDLMTLTAGRLLYQNGFLDASAQYYKKISKKSDYWFMAQEELAWSYMRKGEPQNALSITKSLTFPQFKGWVGIESHLLGAFSSLKVCDYPGVMSIMKSLKGQYGEHLVSLEKLSVDPHQKPVENLIQALAKGPQSVAKLGKEAHLVPMSASRDEVLTLMVKKQNALLAEAKTAEQLYGRSLTFGNLQGQFETLKSQVATRAQMSEGASYQRVQALAKAELEDSKQVLQRLRIVEVEMIQQVDSSAKLLKNAGVGEVRKGTTGTTDKFAMNFANSNEVWFDELSNFKVDVKKGCAKAVAKE
jgi:hypothetical protein